jgi:hypothetical protein
MERNGGVFRHICRYDGIFRLTEPDFSTMFGPMLTTRQFILNKVADFLAAQGALTESRFGVLAVRDSRFVARLREGAGVTLTVIERAEAFMQTRSQGAG